MWGETVRRVRPERERELRTGQWDETAWDSKGGALSESRIAVIEDYRRTAESIEATTARARKALQIIQQQSLTIEQLKNYVNELVQRSNLVAKKKTRI